LLGASGLKGLLVSSWFIFQILKLGQKGKAVTGATPSRLFLGIQEFHV